MTPPHHPPHRRDLIGPLGVRRIAGVSWMPQLLEAVGAIPQDGRQSTTVNRANR